MNAIHPYRRLIGHFFVAALAIAFGSVFAAAPEGLDREHFEGLTGTWRVEVTTYNCETGVPKPSFSSLLTFDEFGTLTGTTANPVFLPGQRSPDHGVWKRVRRNYFTAATEAFIEFSTPAASPTPPFVRGSQRIEQNIELTGKDSFRSEASLTFLDAEGAIVLSGCARATAQRFQ